MIRGIPHWFAAILESLRFDRSGAGALIAIREAEWNSCLDRCDREHLTLQIYRLHGDALPASVARRIEQNLTSNQERIRRVETSLREIHGTFERDGIEFLVLKGFAQYPDFIPNLQYRLQYDIDLYCPPDRAHEGHALLGGLGYEPIAEPGAFPSDHLPAMIRKTGWQWRGDFFDPDIPVAVDLHFRFWDPETEGFDAPGTGEFWERRLRRRAGELEFGALSRADAVAYHSLHLLRHLLRSSARLSHVYELAWFLEKHAADELFWREWQNLHPPDLRRLQAIMFAIARDWFGCRVAPLAAEELGDEIQDWLRDYSTSPIENLFHPNKHELWLHMALLDSPAARRRVVRRRLVPARLPGEVDAVYVPEEQMNARLKTRRRARYLAYIAGRVAHHLRALPSVAWHGARWASRSAGLRKPYWTFLGAASLLNLGLFIFVLIYNLYLLDIGFREDFLGAMNGAFTAGSVAGALPAGALLQRFGLGTGVRVCFGSIGLLSAMRALATDAFPLTALAFVAGAAFSLWVVIIGPAVAQLAPARSRPRAYSLFFGVSIGLGMIGGVAGGQLAQLLGKQTALLAGCALVLAALWPAARIRFPEQAARTRISYPFGPFIRRFLIALLGWNLAVGAFNPFFNTFFARQIGAPVEQIGMVFSASQAVQVVALLAAPLLLKRLGLVNGIVATQIGTGVALVLLASSTTVWMAALAYAAYAAFQYMTEPGLFTLLMGKVRPEEQSGASSLNFFATFSAHAVAAALAGAALSRFGYPVVIASIACIALVSALLFRLLLGGIGPARGTLE